MPITQGQIDALKAKQPSIEKPPLAWETDPDHPDWGTPSAVRKRKDALGAATTLHNLRQLSYINSYVTSRCIKEIPEIFSEPDMERAVWCEPYWRQVWKSVRSFEREKRQVRDFKYDTYVGIDGLDEGEKFYSSDNPEIFAKIEERVKADDKTYEFHMFLPNYSENKHLYKISDYARRRAELNDQIENSRKEIMRSELKRFEIQTKDDDLSWAIPMGFIALVIVVFGIAAAT